MHPSSMGPEVYVIWTANLKGKKAYIELEIKTQI